MVETWKYFLRYGDDQLELTEGKMTVGRSRHCDLSIQEPSISRKHVFLTVDGGKIQLQDLGSSNGTFINDNQVAGESSLSHGDALRLGNALLTVEIGAADATRTTARPLPPDSVPESRETAKVMPLHAARSTPRPPTRDLPTPIRPGSLPDLASLADDPDAEPTKRLDTPDIDWDMLQGDRAGFWPRLGATLIDTGWVLALAWIGHQLAGLLGALLAPVVLLIVTWIGWSYWGTTPGKRLFGLYIYSVDAEVAGRPGTGLVVAAIRLASCFLSLLLFGLGFIAIGFSPARLALHDRLSGTFVLRKKTVPREKT